MKVYPIKTDKITKKGKLFQILDKYLPKIKEKSIVAITSKIISICEGNIVATEKIEKEKLIQKEADYYLKANNKYNINLTIKNQILIPSAGIDESNGNGYYVLWPKDPQKTANKIRNFIRKKFSLKKVGVIITDSKTTPLRIGTTGITIAYSGFLPLKNYIGKHDIFGKKLIVTKSNLLDGLAAASVLIMGEGNEQTPIAILEDVPFIRFQNRNPNKKELKELLININEDLYSEILNSVNWKRKSKKF